MIGTMTEFMNQLCASGERIHSSVVKVLLKMATPGALKDIVLWAYLDTLLEHSEAFRILLRQGKHGSALALLRPIFDTLYRFLWVTACATDKEIEELALSDSFEFPKDMIAKIDDTMNLGGLFGRMKKATWKPMCSYTHSGQLQLSRRLSGSSVRPSYSRRDIQDAARHVDLAVLLIARPFFSFHQNVEGAELVDGFMEEMQTKRRSSNK